MNLSLGPPGTEPSHAIKVNDLSKIIKIIVETIIRKRIKMHSRDAVRPTHLSSSLHSLSKNVLHGCCYRTRNGLQQQPATEGRYSSWPHPPTYLLAGWCSFYNWSMCPHHTNHSEIWCDGPVNQLFFACRSSTMLMVCLLCASRCIYDQHFCLQSPPTGRRGSAPGCCAGANAIASL